MSSKVVNLASRDLSPRSTLQNVFTSAVCRRPNLSSINSTGGRSIPFTFELARGHKVEEMPQTFSSCFVSETAPRGRACVERTNVSYKLVAVWDTDDPEESPRTCVPTAPP